MWKGKIFFRFLFSYIIVVLIPITVSAVAYNNTVKIAEQDAKETSLSTLNQCIEVLNRRLAEVDSIATQLSLNPKILRFTMESNPYINPTLPCEIKNLQKEVAPLTFGNDFIDMLFIYFEKSDVIISGNQSFISLSQFYDNFFKYGTMSKEEWRDKILAGRYFNAYFPVTPIQNSYTNITTKLETEPMLLYIRSFLSGSSNKCQIMITISEDRIRELVQDISINYGGWACITDSQDTLLFSTNQSIYSNGTYLKELSGSAIQSINGQKMILNCRTSSYNGWRYVAALPYNIVMERAQRLKQMIGLILIIAMLLSFISAFLMAYRNCRPIRGIIEILQKLVDGEKNINNNQNEFVYLRKSIIDLISDNKNMQENFKKQLPLLKTIFIERLLYGNFADDKEIQWFLGQLGIEKLDFRVAVSILQIDHQMTMGSGGHVVEMSAIKLIVEDIVKKYLDTDVYFYDLDFDKQVIIFGTGKSMDHDIDEKNYVNTMLENVCCNIHDNHKISIYFTIGALADDYMGISRSFDEAREALNYKTLHNDKSVLWFSEISKAHESYYYPLNIESRLINFTKLGDWKGIDEILKRVYKENFIKRNLPITMMQHLIYELKGTLLKALDILAIEHKKSAKQIMERICAIDNCKSIDEMFTFIIDVFDKICNLAKNSKKNGSKDVMEDILEYINSNYKDSQLGLADLAERFGFASAYLSQLFKDKLGENFSAYLERIRIEKSCELLMKDVAINQVAQEVGYNSVYVFRKAFRRNLGVVPSEYKNSLGLQKTILQ